MQDEDDDLRPFKHKINREVSEYNVNVETHLSFQKPVDLFHLGQFLSLFWETFWMKELGSIFPSCESDKISNVLS